MLATFGNQRNFLMSAGHQAQDGDYMLTQAGLRKPETLHNSAHRQSLPGGECVRLYGAESLEVNREGGRSRLA
jgi:hypothetical protein